MDFKCKTCEAQLTALAEEAQNGLVTCPYCKNVWTIPKKETSPAALSFFRMGEHDLDTCKFEDALSAYQKAAELDKEEPEAYFGMALATYKVQYLKDEVADPPRLQPICHEVSEKVFSTDKNYLKAIELATREQKRIYRERAMEIDEIRDRFEELKESGLDYDCFLCVKVSSEDGGTTQDSHEALRIYNYLKEKGYMPFYSEAIMGSRTGSDYEAHILYALYTSECMLIVCSDEEYLKTKWVKNEYTRFSAMIANEEKERDAVTFVYRGKPIEKLPGRNGKLQGIDLAKPTAYAAIADYVERHTPAAKARREAEEKKRRAEEEARNREFSELKEKLAQMERERASAASPANLSPAELLAMMRKAEEEEKRKREEEKRRAEEEARRKQEREAELRRAIEEQKEERRAEEEARRKAEEERRAYLAQFDIADGVLIKYKGSDYKVVIPDGVTSIGEKAFRGYGLTSIIIPDSVTSIGRQAFERSSLMSITIPNSVASIGEGAFSGCIQLTSIKIPDSVTSIGEKAFSWCNGLKALSVSENNPTYYSKKNCIIERKSKTLVAGCKTSIIPDDVTSIGSGAFDGCTGLKSITIPNGVISIGEGAFCNCGYGLRSVTIPNSVTSIGDFVFYGCIGLTSIVISDSVTSIGYAAFKGCSSLTSIIIPNGVTSIGYAAFKGCYDLTSITIPDSVISIGEEAFEQCSKLTSIKIPQSVSSIGRHAFWGCSGLKCITWSAVNCIEIGPDIFSNFPDLTTIIFGDDVNLIPEKVFDLCKSLIHVTIPKRFKGFMNSGLKKIFGDNWKKIQFTFTK